MFRFLKTLLRWQLGKLRAMSRSAFLGYPSVIVVSGGGSGTTTLIRHLSKYCTTNSDSDRDGLKHRLTIPHRAVSRGSRVLYVRSDVETQIASLRRRGTLRFQAIKIGGFRAAVVDGLDLEAHLSDLIETQRRNFEQNSGPSVLVADFPDFLGDPEPLAQFLRLGHTNFADTMPVFQPRNSSPDSEKRS